MEVFRATVVVPTYNEAECIGILIEKLKDVAPDIDIVVVDDNSPDGTWLKALDYADRGVVVVRRMNMKGLASAVIDGILFSSTELVVVMDADLQHPPEVVPKLIDVASSNNLDIVVASRYCRGGGVERWSFFRKMVSRVATLLAHILIPEARRFSDPLSGFFLVRRSIVDACRSSLRPRGYKVLLEIIARCRWSRGGEVPYVFRERVAGRSKLGMKTIIDYVLHVLELSRWRPLRFAAVGAAGTIVNLGTLELFKRILPVLAYRAFVAGSAVAIEVSTIFNFTLHEKWTFRDRVRGKPWRRLAAFHLAVAPAIAVQYGVANALHYTLSLDPTISQFIGIVAGFLVNYLLSEFRVWRRGGLYVEVYE